MVGDADREGEIECAVGIGQRQDRNRRCRQRPGFPRAPARSIRPICRSRESAGEERLHIGMQGADAAADIEGPDRAVIAGNSAPGNQVGQRLHFGLKEEIMLQPGKADRVVDRPVVAGAILVEQLGHQPNLLSRPASGPGAALRCFRFGLDGFVKAGQSIDDIERPPLHLGMDAADIEADHAGHEQVDAGQERDDDHGRRPALDDAGGRTSRRPPHRAPSSAAKTEIAMPPHSAAAAASRKS